MPDWTQRFITLGDNCEFGLIERAQGYDRSSLLKWCRVRDFSQIIEFFPIKIDQIYMRENVIPVLDDTVVDVASGFLYHTSMFSREENGKRSFVLTGSELEDMYFREREKRIFLAEKMEGELSSGEYTCIFKMNGVFDLSLAKRLAARLREYNLGNRLLYLTDVFPERSCSIEDFGEGLIVGYVAGFAPYNPVSIACASYWDAVCERIEPPEPSVRQQR